MRGPILGSSTRNLYGPPDPLGTTYQCQAIKSAGRRALWICRIGQVEVFQHRGSQGISHVQHRTKRANNLKPNVSFRHGKSPGDGADDVSYARLPTLID